MKKTYFIGILIISLICVQLLEYLKEESHLNTLKSNGPLNEEYRKNFYSPNMRLKKEHLSLRCKTILENVEKEAVFYPVPESTVDKSLKTTYANTWLDERSYKGKGLHEGTDIMASKNKRGLYPVVSITDGTVVNIGWLEKGGYRIGIMSESGTYYYYAHLDSYADISQGDQVVAGEFLGYMGDSGYGKEGTRGEFPVHLHLGIYVYLDDQEISFNPYYLLKTLENNKLKYSYF